jgi:inorganic pyrophosphatase
MNLLTIPAFGGSGVIHVVVESPRGSTVKLKYEPRWEAMSISRPLPLGVTYPFDWGFVPSTAGPDGDPIDALVVWDVGSYPGVVLPCRALGVIQIEQNRRNHDPSERIRNDRILAVPEAARREQDITTIASLPPRVRAELEHLALIATGLEGKDVRIVGWGDAAAALKLISDSATPATSL